MEVRNKTNLKENGERCAAHLSLVMELGGGKIGSRARGGQPRAVKPGPR
jgi:hypothetical protein